MAKVISGLHHDNILIAIETIEKALTEEIKNKLPNAQIKKIKEQILGLKSHGIILITLNGKKKMFVENKKVMIIDCKKETKKNINLQIEKIKIEITKMIKKYNMIVQILRKNVVANVIPTIKNKISDGVKDAMIKGSDTIDAIEYGPENTSISLCFRKKKGKPDGHFLVIKENLLGLLDAYLNPDNIHLWELTHSDLPQQQFPTRWKIVFDVTSKMTIKCQGNPACNKMIKLSVLLSHLTFVERKKFRCKYVTLYLALIKAKYGDKVNIYYCKNTKCVCAETGFLYISNVTDDKEDNVFCEKCNTNHHVHLHQIECSLCKYSFCSTCEQHPYHVDRVCYGVVSDDIKLLLLSSSAYKPCPGCKLPYEKDGGCDHIICNNIDCGIHWCWRCLQKLDSKDPYLHACLSINVVATNVDGAYRDFHVDLDDELPELIPVIGLDDIAVRRAIDINVSNSDDTSEESDLDDERPYIEYLPGMLGRYPIEIPNFQLVHLTRANPRRNVFENIARLPENGVRNDIITKQESIWTKITQINIPTKITIAITCGYILLARFMR
uniref:RBR-type E3 ubiquitin transferase n=1 Tax=viral metagenome TaxID=1070528 RepID=A0A6C0C9E7_9ZZZZ